MCFPVGSACRCGLAPVSTCVDPALFAWLSVTSYHGIWLACIHTCTCINTRLRTPVLQGSALFFWSVHDLLTPPRISFVWVFVWFLPVFAEPVCFCCTPVRTNTHTCLLTCCWSCPCNPPGLIKAVKTTTTIITNTVTHLCESFFVC